MKTSMTWLLAGAALTLVAGTGVAMAADPADAARQAQADAGRAEADAGMARADAQRARADGQRARAEAMQARDEALRVRDEAREEARRSVRIYRGDRDHDVIVYRGHGDRAESLTTLLQLRPEQEPALKAFLEATRPNRDNMVRFDRQSDGDDKTTMQRLDEMSARAADQKASTDRKIAAVKTFYAQLDAKQRKTFDAMPMLMMVGPNIGPMMIPAITPIHFEHFTPPTPPVPPDPPTRPRAPRGL